MRSRRDFMKMIAATAAGVGVFDPLTHDVLAQAASGATKRREIFTLPLIWQMPQKNKAVG